MRIVIVEDEKPAADRLELLLKRYDPDIQVIQRLDSVKGCVSWFEKHGTGIDLVFMDIRLTFRSVSPLFSLQHIMNMPWRLSR